MTDPNELRAAAELITDPVRGRNFEEIPINDLLVEVEEYKRAIQLLARHILATVKPDDGEAVTEEWFRSNVGEDGSTWSNRGNFNAQIVFWAGSGVALSVPGAGTKPVQKTRGDVRRLCAALGIDLKEGA